MIIFNISAKTNHMFNVCTKTIRDFTVVAFGATILYFLKLKENSTAFSSKMGNGTNARMRIISKSTTSSIGGTKIIAKVKPKFDICGADSNLSLTINYTTPLTWNNLIVRYPTWMDVNNRFESWKDVTEYR